jgi:hypothetical protein
VQGKQAQIVSPTQERAILGYLDMTRSREGSRHVSLIDEGRAPRQRNFPELLQERVEKAFGSATLMRSILQLVTWQVE